MLLKYNGKEVEVEFDTNGSEMEDIYIASAFYTDSNLELTDAEIDELTEDNGDALYMEWLDRKISGGDMLMDMERD